MSALARTLDRIDDWMNPIAVKELRQAVRGKFVMVALILSLLGQLVTVAVISISTALESNVMSGGTTAFTALFTVVFTAGVFLVPMYAGFRMAAERADTNPDLLFITTIRPRTIVLGKVTAVSALVILLFSSALPFLMFSYVLRGIDFVSMGVLIALAIVVVISHAITALFIGALPTSRPFKILLGLGFFLGTIGVYAPVLAFASEVLRMGMGVMAGRTQFWTGFLSFIISMLVMDAVLLVLTTAMITPAAANRALPIRIMLFTTWLLSFGAALWASHAANHAGVLQVWSVFQVVLITIVLLSATSERESWGPRVARTIPENPFKRAVAFLFYSGGAGGTVWAIVMYTLTIAAYVTTVELSVFTNPREPLNIVQPLIDGALAMIGYAMTAVLLRRKVLRRVPPGRTWGLVLALFIVLTVLPPIAILTRDAETSDWGTYVHITTMANPFPTMMREESLRNSRTIVLGLWAFLSMLGNAPWFASQVRGFRRHVVRRRDEDTPVAVAPLQELTSE